MMQCSVVNFNDIPDFDKRIDPEFFKPRFLKIERSLKMKNSFPLGSLCKLHDGPFGSELLSSAYSESGVPVLRMQNVTKEGLLNLDNVEFIHEDEANRLIRYIAYPGEVVTTKIGFLGYSTVLLDNYERYFFRRELTRLVIKKEGNLNPYYLATFLNTKYGREQALRYSSGTTRDRVLLTNQRHMLIPIFSSEFQDKIAFTLNRAYELIESSKDMYQKSQLLPISELNLSDWQPHHQMSFIKNFTETQTADSMNAEYFQPKYDEIIKAIKDYAGGWDTAESILNIKDENFIPKEDVVYKYIELANIGNNGEITGFKEGRGEELPTRARRKVSKGDVIVSSIEGSLSCIALITDEHDGYLCSNGFFEINSDEINSETLLVLFKSQIGQLQLKKGCKGTILTAINKPEFEKIVLPKIDPYLQEEIKQKVDLSFKLLKQSKDTLECAKKAVEIAVEEDEKTALDWLNNKVGDYYA